MTENFAPDSALPEQSPPSDPATPEPDRSESPAAESIAESRATEPEPGFGWTAYAERLNGRFAMVGFVLLLLLELFTHQDFLTWVGLR